MRSVVEPVGSPGKRRLMSMFSGSQRREPSFIDAPMTVGTIITLLPG